MIKSIDDKTTVIDKATYNNVDFEVLAYNSLEGPQDIEMAMGIFFANQSGLKNEASKNKVKK